ncbi:MAG TPA: glycosyltransferase family 39 protein [Candidatus Binatia bacterium]|nr:glycosyltransferase family 39 protein [Candidatus Binatia bacterium]
MSESLPAASRPAPSAGELAATPPVHALRRVEVATLGGLFAVQLALRIGIALRYPFDTDEPQHLHVAWAWTQGLVPYRDVFDNHAPLFHMLMAPLAAAIGEQPEILLTMRLAMIPLAAVALACLYAIGRTLFEARVGLWAAAIVGLMPSFLLTSVEFRADDLWTVLWLAALAVGIGDPLRAGRTFAAGLLFGATFATSIKTALLFFTLAAGVALAFALDPARDRRLRDRRVWVSVLACAGGLLLPLAAGGALFAALGALPELLDCLFTNNLAVMALWDHRLLRVFLFVAGLPFIVVAGRTLLRRSSSRPLARSALLVATLLFAATLKGFSPLDNPQDCMPLYPLLAIFGVAGLQAALERRSRVGGRGSASRVFVAIAATEVFLTVWVSRPWRDRTRFEIGLLRDVLHLTAPTDPVMDLKGESVFRRRPFFYALEAITQERFRRGELRDDIRERLIATHTYVSVMDSERFPPVARRFLLENYVPVGHLRVAGKFLDIDRHAQSEFAVELPGRYAILSPRGLVSGALDGSPLDGSRPLEAGRHTFAPSEPTAPLALVWADAAERGYSPFHPNGPS